MLVCKGRVVCCKEGLETDADGGLERGWKWIEKVVVMARAIPVECADLETLDESYRTG